MYQFESDSSVRQVTPLVQLDSRWQRPTATECFHVQLVCVLEVGNQLDVAVDGRHTMAAVAACFFLFGWTFGGGPDRFLPEPPGNTAMFTGVVRSAVAMERPIA